MPVNDFDNYPMTWKPNLDKKSRSFAKTLAMQLEQDIRDGILRPGVKLPPQRELADYLDVNLSTISKAFRICELKGLLSAKVGRGTFVAYDVLAQNRLISAGRSRITIDMGPTKPETSAISCVLDLFRNMLAEGKAVKLFDYPDPELPEWQKEAAVRLLAYCGCHTKPENILFANGGQNAIASVLPAVFRKGDQIAVDDHSYPGLKTAAAMYGLKLVPVASGIRGMEPDALDSLCRKENIQGCFLIPGCHNPTTACMPDARRRDIAGILKKHGCLLVEDGTYQMMHGGQKSVSDYMPEESIYILSLSKEIVPGIRMAFLSVPEKFRQAVEDIFYGLNVVVNPLMAELASRIVASDAHLRILDLHRTSTRKLNQIVNKYFQPEFCLGSDVDIFRWLLLPDSVDMNRYVAEASRRGVLIFGADRFAVGNTRPAQAVRLSVCTPGTEDKLEEGLHILKEITKI